MSFKVRFYGMNKKGYPTTYIINNDFPVNNNNDLLFMKPLENEAYAIILEKAWAAIRKGYKNIEGGFGYKVLKALLGPSCSCIFNAKMEVLTNKYRDLEKKRIEEINNGSFNKKDPEIIFNAIKNSFKTSCPIITTSININEEEGHEYSILGTYSETDPNYPYQLQEFVILKNPWRSGDQDRELEKINEEEINEIVDSFKDIKEINNKYFNTGVFYMPKEYFKKWFRDVTICLPNYKEYFPKVYISKNLYEAVNNFYGYNSNQNYFDISQGNRLIKVNIISKKNFEETQKKIIQNKGSKFAHVYDNNSLSTIWKCENKVGITPDYCFAREKGKSKYNFYKGPGYLDFEDYEIYVPNITMINKGDKCFCITQLKRINNINDYKRNLQLNRQYLENKDLNEIDLFKSDFEQLKNLDDDVQRFLKDVTYAKKILTQKITNGWVNTFEGINLCSNEYANLSVNKSHETHYHVYNLNFFFKPKNEQELLKVFYWVGKKFKCSCFYVRDGYRIKECEEYFTFEKIIYIYKYSIRVSKISISPYDNYTYFFYLEQKYDPKERKTKKFFIYNK